jgi:hypothetical protein
MQRLFPSADAIQVVLLSILEDIAAQSDDLRGPKL